MKLLDENDVCHYAWTSEVTGTPCVDFMHTYSESRCSDPNISEVRPYRGVMGHPVTCLACLALGEREVYRAQVIP